MVGKRLTNGKVVSSNSTVGVFLSNLLSSTAGDLVEACLPTYSTCCLKDRSKARLRNPPWAFSISSLLVFLWCVSEGRIGQKCGLIGRLTRVGRRIAGL